MDHKQLYFLVQRAQHSMNKLGDKVFQQVLGVSSAHLSALFFLIRNNNCLLKDLSAGLDLNNSAVTGLVRRMEAAELVDRTPCAEDGRAFRVSITEKGASVVKMADPVIERLNEMLAGDFSEGEMETVIRFLAMMLSTREVEGASLMESY